MGAIHMDRGIEKSMKDKAERKRGSKMESGQSRISSTPGGREATITGIVLGAGKSSRFGSPKQLLPFGDTTLLGQSARNANDSNLDRVVVLGRASEELRNAVDSRRAEVVENTAYGTGCASSLLAGMDAAGECEAIMLLLGDQPGVKPEYIDHAIEAWRRERPWAAVCSYTGEREPETRGETTPDSRRAERALGHLFIFDQGAFEDLLSLHGDKAVWKLIEAYPERVVEISISAELPPDVDTPEDYEAALAHWRRDGA